MGRVAAARVRRNWSGQLPVCVSCGISFLPALTLHHIDGNEQNNGVANLEWVCWLHHAVRHMRRMQHSWVYDSSVLTPRSKIMEVVRIIEQSKGGVV